MKAKLFLIIAILCAFAGKAWANPTTGVGVGIYGYTDGSVYVYAVSSSAGPSYQSGPTNGTQKQFHSSNSDSQFNIGNNGITRDLTMTLNGRLTFANATSATDVTPDGNFTLTFTSKNYYMADAAVTTRAGAAVENCTVSGKYTRTITITIPAGKAYYVKNVLAGY